MALRKFTSKEIGNNIRKIRVELHQSQQEFGKQAGDYSQDTVAKWESGQVPHAMTLKKIAEMGHRSVDWMFGEENRTKDDLNHALVELRRGVERVQKLTAKGRRKLRPKADRKT